MKQNEQQSTEQMLSEEEHLDLEIAVLLAQRLLANGGYDALKKAASSSGNPPEAIGQFLTQLIMQLHESMPHELNVSPRIYLSSDGFLDQILDIIEDNTGIASEILDKAGVYVMQNMSSMAAQRQQQPGQPAASTQEQQPAPVAPQGGY